MLALRTERRPNAMPITSLICILAGLIVITADYVYGRLMATEAFQTIHAMHSVPAESGLGQSGSLVWLGVVLAMIGGAGVTHYLVKS